MRFWGFLVALFTLVQTTAAHADEGSGHVTFPGTNGHIYRIAADADAAPEDVTAVLDTLAPGGGDGWLATSRDGSQLLVNTHRWDAGCVDGACLAIVRADLSSGRVVRASGALVHAEGFSAIANDGRIVYPARSAGHAADLWRLDRAGSDWTAATRLTARSPFAYNTSPALSPDESRLVFDCADQPYAAVGTAICEVGMDGTGFRIVLGPDGVQPEFVGAQLLDHPTYAPDGSIVFAAERDGTQVWRIGPDDSAPALLGGPFSNDNRPCSLPNGSVASQWLTQPPEGGNDVYLLKIMLPSDHTFLTLQVDEMAAGSLSCGG